MNVIVPFADGFEEIEAVTIIDVLKRADINAVSAFVGKNPVRGAHNIIVHADRDIEEINPDDFNAIVLPGGMPGSSNLKASKKVLSLVKAIHTKNGVVAALCAAPIVLAEAGVIEGTSVTCFPGFEKELGGADYSPEPVMLDKNIITGKGPGCAIPFALKLVEVISGSEASEKQKRQMQVYWM